MKRRPRWPFRPRNVALGDKRSPLLRLLQDCTSPDGSADRKAKTKAK